MKTPPRWQRCIAHHDQEVETFVHDYFGRGDRACLLIAGAGFDPRSATVARLLAGTLNANGHDRLHALFLRERRPSPGGELVERGDRHAEQLAMLVRRSTTVDVEVLSPEDGAVVGGHRAVQILRGQGAARCEGVTDVILDMSALSIGISFPVGMSRSMLNLPVEGWRCSP